MMEAKRRDYPWRRSRRRLLLAVFGLAGAAALGLAALNWRGESSIREEVAGIRAKGEPVTPEEVADRFPAPAPAEDAALSYGRAGETLKAAVSDQAYRDRVQAVNEHPAGARFSGELHQWMEGYLAEHAEGLRLLHEAAKRPPVRFNLDLRRGFEAPLPNLLELRGSAQLLQLEAYVAAENGDGALAADAVLAALAMDAIMRDSPILIMQMIRLALRGMACETVRRILPMGVLSEAQLASIQDALAETYNPEALTNALIGERAMGLHALNHPQQFLPQLRDADRWFPGAGSLAAGVVRMSMTAGGDRERYLRLMTRMVDASRLPVPEALARMGEIGGDIVRERRLLPNMADMIIPNLLRCEIQQAKGDAFLRCAMAALATGRFRLAEGRLPADLRELTPVFLPAVPQDPFDGGPLRFFADEQVLTLYSIGENLVDDHGAADNQLDVVFTLALSAP